MIRIEGLSQEQSDKFMLEEHKRMTTLVYRKPEKNILDMNPVERRSYMFSKWPELSKLYNYKSIIRVGVDAFCHAPSANDLLAAAVHVLMQFDANNSALIQSIEQGFKPHD